MAADSLPANENTYNKYRNWVIKESVGNESGSHILIPEADQAYALYDMLIAPHTPPDTAWCGIVDQAVASGAETTIHATEGIQIDTRQIENGAQFTTFGQEVWYNPITKQYTDTEDAGLWLVGYVVIPTANSVMRFEKRRYAIAGEAT